MEPSRKRRAAAPLDENRLNELALRYVGRFATTRAKLRSYLSRKVRERGWGGASDPDFEGIVKRFADQGYVDDAAYALSKSQALTGRGYGRRRVVQTLRVAGVEEQESKAARQHAEADAVSAALRFAKRRRVGPYAAVALSDPKQREKALAAMIRAGHDFGLARAILDLPAGSEVNLEQLNEYNRHTED